MKGLFRNLTLKNVIINHLILILLNLIKIRKNLDRYSEDSDFRSNEGSLEARNLVF